MADQEVRRKRTVNVHLCPACGRSHKNVDANLLNKAYWSRSSPSYAIKCPVTTKRFKVEVNRGFSLDDDFELDDVEAAS